MSKLTAFIVGFIVTAISYLAWEASRADVKYNASATTFVLYWYFLYRLFHDKNKDA